jgi:hypothetical protein
MSISKNLGQLLKASALSMLLISGATIVTVGVTTDVAHAKSDNGNGNGNSDNGNGGGNNGNSQDKGNNGKSDKSGGSSSSSGSSESKSLGNALKSLFKGKKSTESSPSAAKKPLNVVVEEPLDEATKEKQKNINAALGALNAAHASPNAFLNASPNSRVGRISAYFDAKVVADGLATDLEGVKDILDGMEVPEVTLDEIEPATLAAEKAKADALAAIATLTEQLELAGGEDAGLLEQLAQANADLEASNKELEDLAAAALAAQEYADAQQAVADAEENLRIQEELALGLLEDAANKPVTPEVQAEVDRLLMLKVVAEEETTEETVEEGDVPADDPVEEPV